MPFQISKEEILETINMVQSQNLDIRTITMGINLLDCALTAEQRRPPGV